MQQSIQISTLVIFTLLVVFPRAAMSEVKVTLNNGREIIADSCRETGGRLVCEKMGGSFEIEKKDILDVKGSSGQRSECRTPCFLWYNT